MSVNLSSLQIGMRIGVDQCYMTAADKAKELDVLSFELKGDNIVEDNEGFCLDSDGDIIWVESGGKGYPLNPIIEGGVIREVEEKIVERVIEREVLVTKGLGKQVFNALPFEFKVPEAEQDEAIGGAIEKLISEYMEEHVRTLRIVRHEGGKDISHDIETPHKSFDTLLTVVNQGRNAFIVGPAGSFKTTAGKQVAEALGLPFRAISLNNQLPESRIFGFMNASGDYVPTSFRDVYENGGVFLFDEMDAGNANIIASINMAIENGSCPFPDGLIEVHPDAHFICAANTFGRGADRQYVGRNQLDAATIDRFAFINWDYDEELEKTIAGNDEWVARVHQVRRAVEKSGIRHVVSPRASITGAELLAAGLEQPLVEDMVIWKGLDHDSKRRIEENY